MSITHPARRDITLGIIAGRGGCADQPSTECWQSDPPEGFEGCLNRQLQVGRRGWPAETQLLPDQERSEGGGGHPVVLGEESTIVNSRLYALYFSELRGIEGGVWTFPGHPRCRAHPTALAALGPRAPCMVWTILRVFPPLLLNECSFSGWSSAALLPHPRILRGHRTRKIQVGPVEIPQVVTAALFAVHGHGVLRKKDVGG